MVPAKSLCLDILYSALLSCPTDCGKLLIEEERELDLDPKMVAKLKRLGCGFTNDKLTALPLISKYMQPKLRATALICELKEFQDLMEMASALSKRYLNIVDTVDMGIAAEDLLLICKMSGKFEFVPNVLKKEDLQMLANLKELYTIFERC